MKTIKLKVTAASQGFATLAQPGSPVGTRDSVSIYEITDIPDGTPTIEVVKRFNGTTPMPMSCHSVPFSETGPGRIYFAK